MRAAACKPITSIPFNTHRIASTTRRKDTKMPSFRALLSASEVALLSMSKVGRLEVGARPAMFAKLEAYRGDRGTQGINSY